MREKHRLKVFQNRLVRKILEPNRDGITGESKRLHS